MQWIDSVEEIIEPPENLPLDDCPFCGSDTTRYIKYQHPAGTRYAAGCLNCMAIIDPGWAQQMSTVQKMWNTRVSGKEKSA